MINFILKNILFTSLLLFILSVPVQAQSADEIDISRIEQPKILAMLYQLDIQNADDLDALSANCYQVKDSAAYFLHQQSYRVEAAIEELWCAYKHIHPRKAWNGAIVSFGLMYAKADRQISYLQDDYAGAAAGQILFLNLRLFGGLLNLAVAHEIQEVDDSSHTIRFCYLSSGKTTGSQIIHLQPITEQLTRVIHTTRYRSNSSFRDRHLYPGLHEKAISEFHVNVARYLLKSSTAPILAKD